MACAQKNPLLLAENRTFRGREGINLLVYACRSMLSIFLSFLSNSSFLFFLFSFSVFAYFVVILPLRLLLLSPLLSPVHDKGLYIMPTVTGFSFNYLCLVWIYLPTTTGSSVLAGPLLITRQKRLFCLFVCRNTLTCCGMDALSLYPS